MKGVPICEGRSYFLASFRLWPIIRGVKINAPGGLGMSGHFRSSVLPKFWMIVGVLALVPCSLARADEFAPDPGLSWVREFSLPETEPAADPFLPVPDLPTSLGAWSNSESDVDLDEGPLPALSFFPQSRRGSSPPLFDFDRFQFGVMGGIVDYSAHFKSGAQYVFGVEAHLPMPALPFNHWGLFGEAFISYINRNLPFFYTDKAKNWFGVGVGGDYTFSLGEVAFFRPQAGILYAYWNNTSGVQNGIGGLLGAQFGFYWIKHNDRAVLNITPQFTYNGTDYMFLLTIGLDVIF